MTQRAVQEAVEWGLSNGLAFKSSVAVATQVPFSFTPSVIEQARFERIRHSSPVLAKLIHATSEDTAFLIQAIEPVAGGDPFFRALLAMEKQLADAPRLPVLMMRSDFMDDQIRGPQLIEFNGIAAGMGPFGQRIHQLHQYLSQQWPEAFDDWSSAHQGPLVANRAITGLADGIALASHQIKREYADEGPIRFLMVVQENEDNVYDQHLLEQALHRRGIQTVRRSFDELSQALSTGAGQRLMLDGVGSIDFVYLRAGYQYQDYVSPSDSEQDCCEKLALTRMQIERHRVAVNATVSQQLATSKRVQTLLAAMPIDCFSRFGLDIDEAKLVKAVLGNIRPVTLANINWFQGQRSSDWVLKNQGEGGGHCLFDEAILPRLQSLSVANYPSWALMRRIQPVPRPSAALVVRQARTQVVDDLISEIGIFTVHVNGLPATEDNGYAGYLIRSKSAKATEGGVHSGMGVLDSLAFALESVMTESTQTDVDTDA